MNIACVRNEKTPQTLHIRKKSNHVLWYDRGKVRENPDCSFAVESRTWAMRERG